MDFSTLVNASDKSGFPTVAAIFLLVLFGLLVKWMLKQFSRQNQMNEERNQKQLEVIQSGMKEIVAAISRGGLSAKQQVSVFEIIMTNHIARKLDLVEKILIKNDIHNRRCQIEKNILAEFQRITQEEITILRHLNMPVFAGFLIELDWPVFVDGCGQVIFTNQSIENKILDLKSYMTSFVTTMIKRYESNFTDSFEES